jgi:ketosteroid isomerase-like protein
MTNKTTEAVSVTETSIAVAREFHGAVTRGDIPAVFDLLDPQIEWRAPESLPWGGTFRGHDGVRKLFAIFFDQPPEYGLRREVLEHVGSGERVSCSCACSAGARAARASSKCQRSTC